MKTAQKPDCWCLLDIGNTQTVAGLYGRDTAPMPFQRLARVRFRTDPAATGDEYRARLQEFFDWGDVTRVIVASVVPQLDSAVREACGDRPLLLVNWETRREFELDLPFPQQLGADRLANVTGALGLVAPPFLIVDAGTATTFCLVDREANYVGGAISPGLEIGWRALTTRAAKLFSVELRAPGSSVGKTTESQLQSGVLYGYASLIEGMTDRLIKDAGPDFKGATLIATGGCLNLLQLSPRFRIEPDLTLLGLLRYGQLTL